MKRNCLDTSNTVNHLIFMAIYFHVFYQHGYFRGDLFSLSADLDYARIMAIWTFCCDLFSQNVLQRKSREK